MSALSESPASGRPDMRQDLLICAAVDLSGGAWPERQCERMTASLKLGLAGDISQGNFAGGFWAARRDRVPGVANPRMIFFAMPSLLIA